jgi:hypothetical protein
VQRRRLAARTGLTPGLDALMRSARRRDVHAGGVGKLRTPARRSFVSAPRDSPLVAMLGQAEEELREASVRGSSVGPGSVRGESVGPSGSVSAGSVGREASLGVGSPEPEPPAVRGWRAGVASLASPVPAGGWDMSAALASVVPAWAASSALLTPVRRPTGLAPDPGPVYREPSPTHTETTTQPNVSQPESQAQSEAGGPRAWAKQDWKLLDACFTDARLAGGLAPGHMVDADAVALDDVVDRFCEMVDIKEMGWAR